MDILTFHTKLVLQVLQQILVCSLVREIQFLLQNRMLAEHRLRLTRLMRLTRLDEADEAKLANI